jgi:hypothetical protein
VAAESHADAVFAQFPRLKIHFKDTEPTTSCYLQQPGRDLVRGFYHFQVLRGL